MNITWNWILDVVEQLGNNKRVTILERKIEEMKVSLDALQTEVAALTQKANDQATVIQGITQDYATLRGNVTTLQGMVATLQEAVNANDPVAIQGSIDNVTEMTRLVNAKIDENLAKMVGLDESVAPPAPPEP